MPEGSKHHCAMHSPMRNPAIGFWNYGCETVHMEWRWGCQSSSGKGMERHLQTNEMFEWKPRKERLSKSRTKWKADVTYSILLPWTRNSCWDNVRCFIDAVMVGYPCCTTECKITPRWLKASGLDRPNLETLECTLPRRDAWCFCENIGLPRKHFNILQCSYSYDSALMSGSLKPDRWKPR